MERKLTTIFASDVVGFSKMMGLDEVQTLKILKERRITIDNIIKEHGGIIFGPEAICYYWLGNYELAIQSFSKIKIARTHLFYCSLVYFKKGDFLQASEKLQEAIAITGFDIQTFVNSEPYKNDSNIITIKKDLNSILDRE